MKKHFFNQLKITILLLGGGLAVLAGLASCNNFLNAGDVKKEIQDAIAYNNAKEITVLIQSQEGTGSTVPSGNHTAKQGYDFEISFSEASGYSFEKWIAVSKDDPSKIITDGVFFTDEKSPKTKIKITTDTIPLRLIPQCTERIAVSGQPSPQPNQSGVGWDRSIYVEFSKELAPQSFIFTTSELPKDAVPVYNSDNQISAYTLEGQTYFKNISITSADGFSLAQHFLAPQTDGKYLTIQANKLNRIPFATGETSKTIIVTLKSGISDTAGVSMSAEKTWRYAIIDASDDKATINFTASPTEGVLNAVSGIYSVGQTIDLNFTENADYQFIRWDYDSSFVRIKEPENPDTTITVFEKTTGTQSTQVKAVCAPRPRIIENGLSPVAGSTVPKNTAIQITFDHNLPVESNGYHPQLENLGIAMAGNPVKSSFLTPSITGGTITFAADYSNMLDVPSGQTKTVTVTIPSDFYYELEDEAHTKVYYGGNGKTWNYKINEKTNEETTITFVTNNINSGTITKGPRQDTIFSLGERVDLAFSLDENYHFNGWKIYDVNNNELTAGVNGAVAVTIEDPDALTTKLNVNAQMQGVKVVADTSMKLFVTDVTPNGQINNKDSDITITLSKPLDSSCTTPEFLSKISVKLNGTSVDQYFETRSVNADKITLKNTKYLNVTENEIKTVSISVPQDFYYKDRNLTVNLGQSFNYEYQVNSSTTKKVNVNYTTATAASGSINQNPNVIYNIGDTVDLKFDLAEGFQFTFWQILDQNGAALSEDKIKIDNENVTSTKMHILAPVEGNVSVIAKAFLVPKITTIYPPFESFGSDQDSTIEITFNKAVNRQSFDDFSCITITDASGEKLAIYGSALASYNQSHTSNPFSAYYEEPYFSPDKKILYIPTVKGKYLVSKDSSTTRDIIVNINLSQVKDSDGKAFETFAPHTYRVNKNMDNIAPTLTSAEVFSTSDTTSSYYKKLKDTDFVEWNSDSNFSKNHVGGSVYIRLGGTDVGSGVNKIQVIETYYRAVDGTETQDTPHTYLLDYTKEEDKFTATYTMHSINDGIIKLEFALLDYSELPSNKKTFYVLKDTSIDVSSISYRENDYFEGIDHPDRFFRTVSDNQQDKVELNYLMGKDVFYKYNNKDLNSIINIKIFWGYSKDSITNAVDEHGSPLAPLNFTRDATKLVYLRIECYDAVGNRQDLIRLIPPQPELDADCYHYKPKGDKVNPVFEIIPYNNEVLKLLVKDQGDTSLHQMYLFYSDEYATVADSDDNLALDTSISTTWTYKLKKDVEYRVYIVNYYRIGTEDAQKIWCSPKSSKYFKIKLNDGTHGTKGVEYCIFVDPENPTETSSDSYINNSPAITTQELHGTGVVKVGIENYQNPNQDCTNISYSFKCTNKNTNTVIISFEPEISLPSPASYDLYIIAKDAQGNVYTSSQPTEITLTEDLTSPVFSNVSSYEFPDVLTSGINDPVTLQAYSPNYYKEYFIPCDEGDGATGLYGPEKGKVQLDYYFIPSSATSVYGYTTFSLEELQTTYLEYKKTLVYDSNAQTYIIPFDDLEEGHYTLCQVVKDNNENYAVRYSGVSNKLLNKTIGTTFSLTNKGKYEIGGVGSYVSICTEMYAYDADEKKWEDSINISGRTVSRETYYSRIFEKDELNGQWVKFIAAYYRFEINKAGFYDVEYMYPDYHKGLVDSAATKIICESKNLIDGKNGMQVFCDASTFAHTMYCSKNLSDTDPQIWENKAMETGVVIKDCNFTYTSDNYNGVPSGAYYCTIVHFADGDVLMSDVKKK